MSKKYMVNVPYLEDSDVNPDGSLKPHVSGGKPCVVMVQGVFCGYCSQAKPAFEQFTHSSNKVVGATVQIDGAPSEKKVSSVLTKQDPNYRGVPIYMGFNSQGKYVGTHDGGRDLESLKQFASRLN